MGGGLASASSTNVRSVPLPGLSQPRAHGRNASLSEVELGFFREQQAHLASLSPNLSLASPVKIWLLWDSGKFTRVLWPILGSWGCWLCFNSPRHCQIFLGASRPGQLLQKESSAEVTWKVTPDWGPALHYLCQLAFVPLLFPAHSLVVLACITIGHTVVPKHKSTMQ